MVHYNPAIHHRKSYRLKNYDYSRPGLYAITICCEQHQHLFGTIVDGQLFLNDGGQIAEKCWCEIPNHYPNEFPKNRKIWQQNYYDRILWSVPSYERMANYINNNPKHWVRIFIINRYYL